MDDDIAAGLRDVAARSRVTFPRYRQTRLIGLARDLGPALLCPHLRAITVGIAHKQIRIVCGVRAKWR